MTSPLRGPQGTVVCARHLSAFSFHHLLHVGLLMSPRTHQAHLLSTAFVQGVPLPLALAYVFSELAPAPSGLPLLRSHPPSEAFTSYLHLLVMSPPRALIDQRLNLFHVSSRTVSAVESALP